TTTRSGFSIHGGIWPGSRGCIDLGPNEDAFLNAVKALGVDKINVEVLYDPRLETEPHPLAGSTFFPGAADYLFRHVPGLLDMIFSPDGKSVTQNVDTNGDGNVDVVYVTDSQPVESFQETAAFNSANQLLWRGVTNADGESGSLAGFLPSGIQQWLLEVGAN